MVTFRVLVPFFILIAYVPNAAAGIRPSFGQESCSWYATHIVVVSEGDKIDGNVEVLESWKGDLKKGDRMSIRDPFDVSRGWTFHYCKGPAVKFLGRSCGPKTPLGFKGGNHTQLADLVCRTCNSLARVHTRLRRTGKCVMVFTFNRYHGHNCSRSSDDLHIDSLEVCLETQTEEVYGKLSAF